MKNIENFLAKIPKVELHFHLEGAIPIDCIYEIVKKYDKGTTIKSFDDITDKYAFKDFPHFIKTWHWQAKYLREYEDFTFLAEEIAKSLIAQNIKYVESEVTPADYANQHGLSREGIIQAVRKGLDKYKDKVKVNILYGFNRDFGHEFAMHQLLETANQVREYGVIGVSLGGCEHLYPAKLFKEVYLKAKELGFRTTIHAGEYAGPDSIWSAIKDCKTERIGHCTSAFKDDELIEYLLDHQIHCELNPISNLRTRVVNQYCNHPVKKYYQCGMNISINTDDPAMFNTSLYKEYNYLIETFNFSLNDIKQLLLNAINSSFATADEKNNLKAELENYYRNNL
ncbi:MAG TPA: adenosine deaminase [Victivallales bacterium]|nr:adenosine deaminase [Victivallales bacterium]